MKLIVNPWQEDKATQMRAGTEQSAETSRAKLLMEKEGRQTMRRAARPTVTTPDAALNKAVEIKPLLSLHPQHQKTVLIVKLQQTLSEARELRQLRTPLTGTANRWEGGVFSEVRSFAFGSLPLDILCTNSATERLDITQKP